MSFPLRDGFMLRLAACIYLAGTLGQEAFLKSRNFPLFLQGAVFAALKMLGIHKGFLCFLPCIPSNLAKNRRISLFSEKPLKTAAGRFFLTRSIESAAKQETFDIRQVSVKQLNPTYGYDHRSDFLRCVSVIERLPCAKGAVSEAD